jgi:hypothetical protein
MRSFDYFYVSCHITGRLESEPLSESNWFFEKDGPLFTLSGRALEKEKGELREKQLNSSQNSTPPVGPGVKGKICRVSFYVGVRLEKLLYSQPEVRKGLGLLIGDDLKGANARTTKKIVRNFFDAAAMNIFSSVYVTFEKKSGTTYIFWGERHKTYVAYDARKSFDKICEYLYSTEFKIGQGVYTVVPKSVKERRARRGVKTG